MDFTNATITIDAGLTKGGEPRLLPFGGLPELGTVLRRQRELTNVLERRAGKIVSLVFHRDGRPIRDFPVSWKRACEGAGLPRLHAHDLRRSAARNLRTLGVPECVIMKLCGWRTRAMFERYNIVDAGDVAAAIEKLSPLDTTPTPRRVVTLSGNGQGMDSEGSAGG